VCDKQKFQLWDATEGAGGAICRGWGAEGGGQTACLKGKQTQGLELVCVHVQVLARKLIHTPLTCIPLQPPPKTPRASPVMVLMHGLSVHHFAKPKSHSLMRGGSLSSSRVLSIFRSLGREEIRVDECSTGIQSQHACLWVENGVQGSRES
jgi:hypothetical protein